MINLYRNSFYVLIVCSLFIISPQTVSNPFFDLQTTPGGLFQTPTGMSGLQSQTNTPTDTPTVTSTTTLIPLPAITLIFPAHTKTPVITQKPTPIFSNSYPNSRFGKHLQFGLSKSQVNSNCVRFSLVNSRILFDHLHSTIQINYKLLQVFLIPKR